MKKLLSLVSCASLLALSACSDERPPAPAAPAPKPKKTEAEAGASTQAAPFLYSYNPTAKRDPFRSPALDQRGPVQSSGPCNEPLCQFDLDQLTLVAVVTGDANPLAMVEDPQGRGYLIRRNARMGRQGGKVTQILRDSITVTELFVGADGKTSPNPISVGLKPDEQKAADLDFNTGKSYP